MQLEPRDEPQDSTKYSVGKVLFTLLGTAVLAVACEYCLFNYLKFTGSTGEGFVVKIVVFLALFAATTIIGRSAFGKDWFGETNEVFIDTFQIKETQETFHVKTIGDEVEE